MNDRIVVVSMPDQDRGIEEPGTFIWDLQANRVNADAAVANLFGLDEGKAYAGLPIETFLSRVHPGDKSRMAKSLHQAIVSGHPYRDDYRLISTDTTIVHVMACGRCFRNLDGIPNQFSGIIFLAGRLQHQDILLDHLALAHSAAEIEGDSEIVETLEGLIKGIKHRRQQRTTHETH